MSPRKPFKSRSKPVPEAKLNVLLVISLCAFTSTIAYYCWQRFYNDLGWPYNSPLYYPGDRFNDFRNMIEACRDLSKAGSQSLYLPAANLYFYLFSLVRVVGMLQIYLLLPTLCLVWYAGQAARDVPLIRRLIYIGGIFLVSHPFLFAIDRANLDLHIFMFIAVFGFCHQGSKPWMKVVGCCCLATAIAFKAYPVLFAVLYLKDRRYREFVGTACVALGLTVAAIVLEGGAGAAIGGFISNVGQAGDLDIRVAARYNIGVFNATRLVLDWLKMPEVLGGFASYYTLGAVGVLVVICGLAARRQVELWRSATALACAMCFIPKLSNDYRLLMLIIPLVLFIQSKAPLTKAHMRICVLFGFLLIPKGHFIFYFYPDLGSWGPGLASTASLINPALLVCLTILVLLPSAAETFEDSTAVDTSDLPGNRTLLRQGPVPVQD